MQKNKINKQRGSILLALLPLLILFSASFAAPLITTSLVQTLADSPVYQNLFGSDAGGVSYGNPSDIVLGKGDKALPNFQCIKSGGPGQCGVTATAMALTFITGKQYTPKGLLDTEGGGPNSVPIEGTLNKYTNVKWETTEWDFGRIQRSIDQNYPVIMYSRFKSSGTEHITVVWGYRNDGHLIVNSAYNYTCKLIYPTATDYNEWGAYPGKGKVMVIPSQIK